MTAVSREEALQARPHVFIAIGNSDNKLSQQDWSEFVVSLEVLFDELTLHGSWFSRPDAPWQNACWELDVSQNSPVFIQHLKARLVELAAHYRQDSIMWAESIPEFLGENKMGAL